MLPSAIRNVFPDSEVEAVALQSIAIRAKQGPGKKARAMEKQNRVPQFYGYSVCLVAVITVLISVTSLMNAVIDLGDPLHAVRSRVGAPSLASFEN